MVPYLENNTDNIIEYPVSDIKKNKIKKRYFWDLLKKKWLESLLLLELPHIT